MNIRNTYIPTLGLIQLKMNKLLIIFCVILGLGLISCQNSDKNNESQEKVIETSVDKYASELLELALTDSTSDVIYTNLTQINDEETAIRAVEPILFEGYGKENILEQKPYKTSKINDYWVIEGSHKGQQLGGVFHLVLDSKNGTIIYLIHGK